MGLGAFAAGPYEMTYAGGAVGLVTSGGHNFRYRPAKRKIDDTQTYGQTLIDGIYRGMTGVCLLVTFKEWNAVVRGAIWPYGANTGGSPTLPLWDGTLGTIGVKDSDKAKPIILTAAAGSPAAGALGPATFTTALAILSDQNDISVLMAPDERDIPVLFDLLLYDDGGVKRFFSIT